MLQYFKTLWRDTHLNAAKLFSFKMEQHKFINRYMCKYSQICYVTRIIAGTLATVNVILYN